jgi:YNFM family putative membrane transporter
VAVDFESVVVNVRAALGHKTLRLLFLTAFLVMGSFSALYNYVAFLLMKPPYSLNHAQVGWIFLLYLVGIVGSTALGRMADGIGRSVTLPIGIALQAAGALVTLAGPLELKILGIGLFTFGFFGAHATASGWVGARSGALKATAATLYLLAYYCGVTIGGWSGGYFWIHLGWPGVLLMVSLSLAAALGIALSLGKLETTTPRETAPRYG